MTGLHTALDALAGRLRIAVRGPGASFRATAPAIARGVSRELDALLVECPAAPAIDAAHIEHQRAWSTETFGPREIRGPAGPLDHIRKEFKEVAADPTVLEEWVDVIILGFDGAWRAGHEPQAIIDAIKAKQAENEARTWPDWRTMPPDQAIEHVRATPDMETAPTREAVEPPDQPVAGLPHGTPADLPVATAPPFPDREHHLEPCPGCGHVLGVHADTFGCVHGWTYDNDGHAVTEGCDCPLVLSATYRPPQERDL